MKTSGPIAVMSLVSFAVFAGCFVGTDASPAGGSDGGGPEADGGMIEDGATVKDAGDDDPCAYVGAPATTCCAPDGTERYPICKDGNFYCPDGYSEAPLDSCGNECGEHGLCVPGELPPGPIDPMTPCPSPHEDLYMTGPGCTPEGGGNGFCCTEADPCWVMGAPYLTCCREDGEETSPRCEWGEFLCPEGFFEAEPGSCKVPCEGLEFCDCFKREDCEVLSEDCICPCDYECPGEPPCACGCGGGKYLGCAARTGSCKDTATDCPDTAPVRCPGEWVCSDAAFCGYRCDNEPYCLYSEDSDRSCAAYQCDLDKFTTSGMTEGFGIGKLCDFLVICADTKIDGGLKDAILDAFPEMECGDVPDYTCGEDAVASCIAYVKTLSEKQVGDACRLSTDTAVSSMVCAGDL